VDVFAAAVADAAARESDFVAGGRGQRQARREDGSGPGGDDAFEE
jgi:hypothetical protein